MDPYSKCLPYLLLSCIFGKKIISFSFENDSIPFTLIFDSIRIRFLYKFTLNWKWNAYRDWVVGGLDSLYVTFAFLLDIKATTLIFPGKSFARFDLTQCLCCLGKWLKRRFDGVLSLLFGKILVIDLLGDYYDRGRSDIYYKEPVSS